MSNNVEAVFTKGRTNIETVSLWQYDYGQVLQIIGIDLPEFYEVHFSNEEHGVSTTTIGNADGVAIPDTYLTSGNAIYAWLYLHTGEDDGETVYEIRIPVRKRASISDSPPTPVQQEAITQAIAALNAASEDARSAAEDAASASRHVETIADGIPATVEEALRQAKDSGNFDGYSPIVSISEITGGHRISIEDAHGTNSFNVMDGEKNDQWKTELPAGLAKKADIIYDTVKDAEIAMVRDGAKEHAVKELKIAINPAQNGWAGCILATAGKNLWKFDSSYTVNSYDVLIDREPYYLPKGTYTFSCIPNITDSSLVVFGYHADGTRTEIARLFANTTRKSETKNITKDIVSIYFVTNAAGTISDIQLELGSIVTSYEPYLGSIYPVTWENEAGTVYGGTLDVINGVVTATRASVDLGTLNWTYNSNQLAMVSSDLNNVGDGQNIICSQYQKIVNIQGGNLSINDKCIAFNKETTVTTGNFASGALVIKDTDYSDAAEFKSAMSGVQLVYELAVPIVYNLQALEDVKTLKGVNNVWADTGKIVSMEYPCDTKLYIDKKFTQLQALILDN